MPVSAMRLRLSPSDIGLFLLVAVATFWAVNALQSSRVARFSTTSTDARWGAGYMPNLKVVDQNGKSYRFYDDLIKNKRVIVNFIYTSCSQICGLVTSRMAVLQEKLGDSVGSDYHMYSITVDPEHDGPAELKRHADAFNAKPGWLFLTGDPDDIRAISDKLGERSKALDDHRQDILLGDDIRQNWSRDSVFGDLDSLALTIHAMKPDVDRDQLLQRASVADMQMVELAPGQALFARMCSSCHSIGGGVRVGPDLKDVVGKRDRTWLTGFISRPDKMFAARDPLALEIDAHFPAVTMPNLGLSEKDAGDVIAYLEMRSSKP